MLRVENVPGPGSLSPAHSAGISARDETAEVGVLSLVHNAHAAAAQLLNDAVVRNGLADHWRESYLGKTGKSTNAERLGGHQMDGS